MKITIFPPILVFVLCATIIQALPAQRFGAAAVLGPNLSQVRGDNLAGFHKLGIHAGVRGIVFLSERFDANIELLYNQSGSQDGLFSDNKEFVGIDINTIEIPIYFDLKDWMVKDDEGSFAKVSIHGGLSISQIIDYEIRDLQFLEEPAEEPNDTGYNLILGARMHFSRNWAISLRFSRQLNTFITLTEESTQEQIEQRPYYVSLRTEYIF